MTIVVELFILLFFSQILFSNSDLEPESNCRTRESCPQEESYISYSKSHHSIPLRNTAKPESQSWSHQDFKTTIRTYYSNYSELDFKVSDFEILFRKGILTENQAILIWENLLNSKTERNLEWLEYSKFIKPPQSSSSSSLHSHESKYFQSISILFHTKEFKYHSLFTYVGGIIIYLLTKSLFSYPKINIVLLAIVMILNILNSFYFYNNKCFFTSCVSLCSFLSNIYFIYLNIAVLSGEKEVDCSIFHVKHFKKRKHFFLKTGICSFILLILVYMTSFSLRFHLNYVIAFFLFEKIREMTKNFYRLNSPREIQPINNFVSLVFGLIIFTYTNVLYYLNISFSYQLNSFLFVNNFITFYYFWALDKYVFIQRNDLGDAYINGEKVNEKKDKYQLFEELRLRQSIERGYHSEDIFDGDIIDILLLVLALTFLISGFLFTTYFYIVVSFIFLHTLMKNSLVFFNIKTSRIISGFLLLMYLLLISNLDKISFSYVNEIIALYDQKSLDALLQFVKLAFFVILTICIYFSEDYSELFNFYNYSSYQYISREINIQNNPKIAKILIQSYSTHLVISEILNANIDYSIDKVKSVLEIIYDVCNDFDEMPIEASMKRTFSNAHITLLLIDYAISYITIFVINDILNKSSNSFFYITFLVHRIGLYLKIGVIILEYSKTPYQQYACLMINFILMHRLFYFCNSDYIDCLFSMSFFVLSYLFYMIFLINSHLMNVFFVLFFWFYFNVNIKAILGLPIIYGMVFSKFLASIFDTNRYTLFVFIFVIFAFGFLFSFLNFEIIKLINYQLQIGMIKLFGFDLMESIVKFCFIPLSKDEYFELMLIAYIKKTLSLIRNYVGSNN